MALDLHIHSRFSDGTNTPTEIVALARARHLTTIALTDHDTLEGVPEALTAGEDQGVEVLTGLEISVRHRGQPLHILGYCFRLDDDLLNNTVQTLQRERRQRNVAILARLAGDGLMVNLDEIDQRSGIGQTGRPHIAQVLVEKGYVRCLEEAFQVYLGRGARAYVPRQVHSPQEAIAAIHSAGGICVLAHPLNIDPSLHTIPALITELSALGLDGLEVYYPTHSARSRSALIGIARRNKLIVTGGSDFHGAIRPGTTLAGTRIFRVPHSVREEIEQCLLRRQHQPLSRAVPETATVVAD